MSLSTTTDQQTEGPPRWKIIASRKQAERRKALDSAAMMSLGKSIPLLPPSSAKDVRNWLITSGDSTTQQIAITESLPSNILKKLAVGDWTAGEVLLAFVARAAIAQHLTNPLTDIFVEAGLAKARELNEHLKKAGRPVGPLHGLPISLKDVMNVKGHATTYGFVALAGS